MCSYDPILKEVECLTYLDMFEKFGSKADGVGAWISASMAFAIMAVLALTAATLAMAGHAVLNNEKLKKPALGAAGIGILFQLIAISIFAANFETEDDTDTADVIEGFYSPTGNDVTVGLAMILVIVGMLLNVAGLGVYTVVGKNK